MHWGFEMNFWEWPTVRTHLSGSFGGRVVSGKALTEFFLRPSVGDITWTRGGGSKGAALKPVRAGEQLLEVVGPETLGPRAKPAWRFGRDVTLDLVQWGVPEDRRYVRRVGHIRAGSESSTKVVWRPDTAFWLGTAPSPEDVYSWLNPLDPSRLEELLHQLLVSGCVTPMEVLASVEFE